ATAAADTASLKTWDSATGEKDAQAEPEREGEGSSPQKRPAVTVEESNSDMSSSVSSLVRLPPAPTEKEFDEDISLQSQQGRVGSGQTPSNRQSSTQDRQGPPVTVRLKYQQDEHGHHHVIGREGTLTRCEDEPIHAPGAVQSYGVIIVLEEDVVEGRLIVRQVSENVHRILGLSIPYLFSLECFSDIFSYEQAEVLWKHITFLEDPNMPDEDDEPLPSQSASQRQPGDRTPPRPPKVLSGPEVFNITGQGEPTSADDSTPRVKWRCWVAAHRPVVPKGTRGSSRPSEPPTSFSAMKTEGDEPEPAVSDDVAQLQEEDAANDYPRLVALEFELENDDENPLYSREIFPFNNESGTGGSRTSGSDDPSALTRGDSSGSGKPSTGTPTTSSATTATPMPGEGQVPGAEGLPPSAPLTNAALHALDDAMARAQETEAGRTIPNLPQPGQIFSTLDSPEGRMVSAGSVSDYVGTPADEEINQRGLSGDHTCRPSGNVGTMDVFAVLAEIIEQLGEAADLDTFLRSCVGIMKDLTQFHRVLIYQFDEAWNGQISTIPTDHHPTGYIVSNAEDLLSLFSADYGILVIGEGAKILGPNNIGRELLIVAQYLRMKQFTLIQASQSIARDFPDLMVPSLDVLSGLLYVPLSPGGRDFICFFRKGQMKDVIWAGKPHKAGEEEIASLEPRTSFKAWAQTVMGRCRSWTDEQLETAGVLALIYGKAIWRQKENAVKSTQLASLLLTNASHEVRTPLNQIIGFLELALEANLDDETRHNLSHAHTASKSLLFTINDLLDLTRLESGHLTQFNDTFDLPALISESCAPYVKDAHRKNLTFDILTSGCPQWVMGDSRKLSSVISNLVANAVKYTSEGGVTVEAKPFQEPDGLRDRESTETTKAVAIEIIVADTGCGIPNHTLEDIFRQFEQVERPEDKISLDAPLPGDKPSGLGLGLAVVARIVEQAGGQLRVDSGPGGSRFSFLLPFTLPEHKGHRSFTNIVSSRPGSHTSGTSEVEDFVSAISASHMSPVDARESQPALVLRREPNTVQSGEGVFPVQDSRTGVRGVKMDPFFLDRPAVEDRGPAALEQSQRPGLEDATEDAEEPESTRPLGQLRVLVVDDDKINSTLMQKRLSKWNHIAVPAMNGQEAKETIESDFDFDCIMMDLQMPILDGYQATSAIRSFEERERPILRLKSHRMNGRIPIFAVSASLAEDQRADLWELGLDGWLLKPIMWDRFQDLLEGVTNLDQRRKDMYQTDSWEKGGWLGWYEGNGPQ
ncbi:Light-sensor Protein kinase, partial [Tulasnella sp. 417]